MDHPSEPEEEEEEEADELHSHRTKCGTTSLQDEEHEVDTQEDFDEGFDQEDWERTDNVVAAPGVHHVGDTATEAEEEDCGGSGRISPSSSSASSVQRYDLEGLPSRVQGLQVQDAEQSRDTDLSFNPPPRSALGHRVERMVSEQRVKEDKELTFRPTITAAARRVARCSADGLPVAPARPILEQRMARMAAELQEKEERECTFRPTIGRGPVVEMRRPREERLAKIRAEQRELEEKECTFRPQLLAAPRSGRVGARPSSRGPAVAEGGSGGSRRAAKLKAELYKKDAECTFRPRITSRSRALCKRSTTGAEPWHQRLASPVSSRPRKAERPERPARPARPAPRPPARGRAAPAKLFLDAEGFKQFLSLLGTPLPAAEEPVPGPHECLPSKAAALEGELPGAAEWPLRCLDFGYSEPVTSCMPP